MQIYERSLALRTGRFPSQTVECKTRPGPEAAARVGGGAERRGDPKWPGATAPGLRVACWGPGGVRGLGTTSSILLAGLGCPWQDEPPQDTQLLTGRPQRERERLLAWPGPARPLRVLVAPGPLPGCGN